MLHRIQIDGITSDEQDFRDLFNLLSGNQVEVFRDSRREMRGPSCSPRLCELMRRAGLPARRLTNRRARFYFTDRGWHAVGASLLHEAKALGYTVKYTRRGRPGKSQVVYQDQYQVALLPNRRGRG
jgi:hypothetical protein